MIIAAYIIQYLAVACYAASAVLALSYVSGATAVRLARANVLAAAGMGGLVLVFLLRLGHWRLLPMSTPVDTLNLLVVFSTAFVFLLFRQPERHSLACFYWPLLALVMLVSGYLAAHGLAQAPKDLATVLLAVHVGLAYIGFALFLVASVASLAYIFQAQHLKRKRTQGLFQKLPSLQQLDQTLYTLVAYGYPTFAVTLGVGLLWAYADSSDLGETWWWSPKVFLAAAMAALYSASFHARRRNLLRGPKLAYLMCIGFAVIFTLYVLLDVLGLSGINFWEGA